MRALGWGLDSLPRIARGEGSYLYDTTSRRYLDGSGGPAAFSIGHGNPEVNAANRESNSRIVRRRQYHRDNNELVELSVLRYKE